jgi:hypothetical protein
MPRRSGSGRTPGSTEDRRPTPGENPQLVPRDRVTRTALKHHPTDCVIAGLFYVYRVRASGSVSYPVRSVAYRGGSPALSTMQMSLASMLDPFPQVSNVTSIHTSTWRFFDSLCARAADAGFEALPRGAWSRPSRRLRQRETWGGVMTLRSSVRCPNGRRIRRHARGSRGR